MFLKKVVKGEIDHGINNIGVKIAPMKCATTTTSRHGSLVETSTTAYGRKIPLTDIIMAENQRLLIEISRSSFCY
jgi:hypothetical protein